MSRRTSQAPVASTRAPQAGRGAGGKARAHVRHGRPVRTSSRTRTSSRPRRSRRGAGPHAPRQQTPQHPAGPSAEGAGARAHRLHVGRDTQEPELAAALADALRVHHLAHTHAHTHKRGHSTHALDAGDRTRSAHRRRRAHTEPPAAGMYIRAQSPAPRPATDAGVSRVAIADARVGS
jgi:hypothetical protein